MVHVGISKWQRVGRKYGRGDIEDNGNRPRPSLTKLIVDSTMAVLALAPPCQVLCGLKSHTQSRLAASCVVGQGKESWPASANHRSFTSQNLKPPPSERPSIETFLPASIFG